MEGWHKNRKWYADVVDDSGKVLPEYQQWNGMKGRCKDGEKARKRLPSYVGCKLHPPWYSFDVWLKWAEHQQGFLNRDAEGYIWQQDKDILSKDGKLYSPDTCVFIPRKLNGFFIPPSSSKITPLPVGVTAHPYGGGFRARINNANGKVKHVGLFASAEAARAAYEAEKILVAAEWASKYDGLVDSRIIHVLRNYEDYAIKRTWLRPSNHKHP